jgi:hypothetical protein
MDTSVSGACPLLIAFKQDYYDLPLPFAWALSGILT